MRNSTVEGPNRRRLKARMASLLITQSLLFLFKKKVQDYSLGVMTIKKKKNHPACV